MPLDFSGQSLVSHSFKGQDLAEANFSRSDIRSADFTKANLRGANFHQARAGVSQSRRLLHCGVVLLCSYALGMVSVIVGIVSVIFWLPESAEQFGLLPGALCLLALAGMGLPLVYQGFTRSAFQITMIASAIVIAGIGAGTLTTGSAQAAYSAGSIASAMILALANVVILTSAGLVGGRWLVYLCVVCTIGSSVKQYHYIYWPAVETVSGPSSRLVADYWLNHVGMVMVILGIAIAGVYVASRVLAKDERFDLVKNVANNLTTLGGTTFHRADLTDADCTEAILKCTDLSKANIERTNFHRAQQLYTSKLNSTILDNSQVLRLAMSKSGHRQSYQGLNLQGLNLADADLTAADFTNSNLNQATLVRAILANANLTKTQAVGARFQHAQLTGTCIEAWNIDSSTQLADIDCQYVYLRGQQQERRPSSGFFQPGEFTQLFQEVIDTIDLIFQSGVDWQALNTMLAQANQSRSKETTEQNQSHAAEAGHSSTQMFDQSQPLTIRSVENKNDGAVVVRINAPPDADKSDLYENLTGLYNNALKTIEASFQKQLEAKDEQIESYRQQQTALSQIILTQPTAQPQSFASNVTPTKLVHLKLTTHPSAHYLVNLQIGEEGKLPFLDTTGTLPFSHEVFEHCQQWQASYRRHLMAVSIPHRIEMPKEQLTNVSIKQLQQELSVLTQRVHEQFNRWLTDAGFRALRERLLENLNPNEQVRIVLQTDNPQLWKLPWHSWEIIDRYPHSELTISTQEYQYRDVARRNVDRGVASAQQIGESDTSAVEALSVQARLHPLPKNNTVKILAVLGRSDALNVQADCHILRNLPQVQLSVLNEPSREVLTNHLWDHPCDILFFAGHSVSHNGHGILHLNATDSLTLPELKHALQRACQQGLQLAIFNSCDGLDLVHALSNLSLQQMIAMREAVPDEVAQVFLQNLITAFADGQPLPQAIREAREKLQGLEDRFPCATWLPVLCQTAATPPLTWESLKGET